MPAPTRRWRKKKIQRRGRPLDEPGESGKSRETDEKRLAKILTSAELSSQHEKVSSTHIFKSIRTKSTQEITRARQLHDEKLAVVKLSNDKLTMRAVHAPRESLRMYLKKHIPTPIPSGDKNILNKRNKNLTLLHESVIFLKHDITDLLLALAAVYGK